jgi:membrane protein required for colicin V production
LNSLDIIVFALVLMLGIKGILKGFVAEVSGFLAIIGGVFVASRFGAVMSDILGGIFSSLNHTTLTILSFLVVFGLFWFGVVSFAGVLTKSLQNLGLGTLDKTLGFVVSGGKIFLVLSVIAFASSSIAFLKPKVEQLASDSIVYPIMVSTGGFLINLKPDDFNTTTLTDKAKAGVVEEVTKSAKEEIKKK